MESTTFKIEVEKVRQSVQDIISQDFSILDRQAREGGILGSHIFFQLEQKVIAQKILLDESYFLAIEWAIAEFQDAKSELHEYIEYLKASKETKALQLFEYSKQRLLENRSTQNIQINLIDSKTIERRQQLREHLDRRDRLAIKWHGNPREDENVLEEIQKVLPKSRREQYMATFCKWAIKNELIVTIGVMVSAMLVEFVFAKKLIADIFTGAEWIKFTASFVFAGVLASLIYFSARLMRHARETYLARIRFRAEDEKNFENSKNKADFRKDITPLPKSIYGHAILATVIFLLFIIVMCFIRYDVAKGGSRNIMQDVPLFFIYSMALWGIKYFLTPEMPDSLKNSIVLNRKNTNLIQADIECLQWMKQETPMMADSDRVYSEEIRHIVKLGGKGNLALYYLNDREVILDSFDKEIKGTGETILQKQKNIREKVKNIKAIIEQYQTTHALHFSKDAVENIFQQFITHVKSIYKRCEVSQYTLNANTSPIERYNNYLQLTEEPMPQLNYSTFFITKKQQLIHEAIF